MFLKSFLFILFSFFCSISLLSLQSYAGGDPDDFAQEEEQVTINLELSKRQLSDIQKILNLQKTSL